ncbi:MAG: hypothetical protein ACK5CY_00645 [Bacteroidia bacterium]
MASSSIFEFKSKAIAALVLFSVLSGACRRDEEDPTLSCTEISAPTTWADRGDGIDYILDCDLVVSAKLTIAPGVVIQCNNNASITIENNGALVAVGSSAAPIIFQGESSLAGVWQGLYIKSNSPENELRYCTISHTGSGSFDGADIKAAIRLRQSSLVKILNCTINKSARDGIYIEGFDSDSQNPISVFQSNSISECARYPLNILGATVDVLDGMSSTYPSNTNPYINIRGGRLFGDHIWKKTSIPYRVEAIVSAGYYGDNGNLTLNPGTTLKFVGDAGLCTGDYSTGSWMRIVGTDAERITLTGETQLPGSWKGIAFQSTQPQNTIQFADISFGGGSSYTGNTAQKGNILAGSWSAGSVTISDATVSGSIGYGIYATMPSPEITWPSSVVFSNNASGNYFHE